MPYSLFEINAPLSISFLNQDAREKKINKSVLALGIGRARSMAFIVIVIKAKLWFLHGEDGDEKRQGKLPRSN